MVKSLVLISLALLVFKPIVAQPTASKQDDRVLFKVNNQPITVEEFTYVYKKNNGNNDDAFTKSDIKNYFDLFVNFKLKIQEAERLGLDQNEDFKTELKGYLEQLKKPYLSENQVTERLVRQAYDRFGEEIRASHILIKTNENDTLTAYQKAVDLKKQIENGGSFEEVALKYSTDPSVSKNRGDLGYFTSFQMVYPFESAAYETPEGQISEPVRTKFGYHLIKVTDKRPSNGRVQVSHIMIRHKSDSNEVRNKIFDLHEQATSGVDWNELVKQHSDDNNSKNTNGILRPFGVAQMPYDFQEEAFQLSQSGDISDPVMTKFGWHIIKLVKKIPVEPFEKLEQSISARIQKDSRSELNQKVLIERLKRENGFTENSKVWEKLSVLADDSLVKAKWSPDISKISKKVLFSVGNIDYTVTQFVDFVIEENKTSSSSPTVYLNNLYTNFKKDCIIAYEEAHLEEKYIDYRMLVKEYREGIMLFQLMEDKVWNRAVEDSIGLAKFYEENKNSYKWGERAEVNIYSSKDIAVIKEVKQALKQNDTIFLTKENLYKKYNTGSSVQLDTDYGTFERGAIEVLDQVKWKPGIQEKVYAGQTHLIQIKKIHKPRVKDFNESKGAVISDYQTLLEKEWVKKLKEKYTVQINDTVLNEVYEDLAL